MIVGISGAQGQGKSTLIAETLKADHKIHDIGLKTSRNILNDWGMTLDEVNRYPPLKVKFQEELFNRHFKTIQSFQTNRTKLVERTFADIFAYAVVSLGPFNEYANWLEEYYHKCKIAQYHIFDLVIYLSGREYVPETDGVRSVNTHFNSLIDHLVYKYSYEFEKKEGYVQEILTPDLDKRVVCLRDYIFHRAEAKL